MGRTEKLLLILVGVLLTACGNVGAGQQPSPKYTIVPGERVGDYTLGMTKDEVLSKLGEPETIQLGEDEVVRRGEAKYSPNNPPSECILHFGDLSFWIEHDSVDAMSVRSPLYKLSNRLGVGASEQNIKQAYGEDFKPREVLGKDFLCYDAKGLAFAIDKKNQTVTEILVCYPEGAPKVLRTLPRYDPDSENPFQVDLRDCDLSKLDLRKSIENLMYADFDDRTVWPAPDRMPSGFDWQKIMELGKNPGLGVRSLHKKGITGRGVRVAIIDQPLLVDHQEYTERVRFYEEMDLPGRTEPAMHGAAVASIALGKTVGVAPEAELYYIGMQFFGGNTLERLARSVHRILEVNEQLPKDNKIRVISISRGWMPSHDGYKDITEAVQKAQAAGMLIVCPGSEHIHEGLDFGVLGRSPLADPEVFESYEPGLFTAKRFWARQSSPSGNSFSVPMDSRTTASPTGIDEYVFYRIGGYSWAVPYIAGLYALAVQADPAITPERFWASAVQTGRIIELKKDGKTRALGPIVDPVRLIGSISDNVQLSQQLPSKQIIVPGLSIGDYTLGMSKDEVLGKLGEPELIFWGRERFTLDNLPSRYFMSFRHLISFCIVDDSVTGISVFGPPYKFANGLEVGDSEQKIKEAFGDDFKLEEFESIDVIIYEQKGIRFEINKEDGTIEEINVIQKTSRGHENSSKESIPPVKPFDDVRAKDLSKYDLSTEKGLIATLTFNRETVWPEQDKMPAGSSPEKTLTDAMNPGLGVRDLHKQGITGKGVNVAIIDQPLFKDHPEYDGKIMAYYDTGCDSSGSSMHGPAVASLLVGANCGTAPDARIYYAAAPSWKADAAYHAKGLDWIIEQNEKLPKGDKIRVVSVSSAPSGPGSPFKKNREMWDEACARAKANGIMVLDCTNSLRGFISRGWYDPENPESVNRFNPGTPPPRDFQVDPNEMSLYVPSSCRTTAQHYDFHGRNSYIYWARGGLSWSIPYCAGVLAMGWQIRPDLSPERMKELLFASAYVHESGARIIHPTAFVDLIRKQGNN